MQWRVHVHVHARGTVGGAQRGDVLFELARAEILKDCVTRSGLEAKPRDGLERKVQLRAQAGLLLILAQPQVACTRLNLRPAGVDVRGEAKLLLLTRLVFAGEWVGEALHELLTR